MNASRAASQRALLMLPMQAQVVSMRQQQHRSTDKRYDNFEVSVANQFMQCNARRQQCKADNDPYRNRLVVMMTPRQRERSQRNRHREQQHPDVRGRTE